MTSPIEAAPHNPRHQPDRTTISLELASKEKDVQFLKTSAFAYQRLALDAAYKFGLGAIVFDMENPESRKFACYLEASSLDELVEDYFTQFLEEYDPRTEFLGITMRLIGDNYRPSVYLISLSHFEIKIKQIG